MTKKVVVRKEDMTGERAEDTTKDFVADFTDKSKKVEWLNMNKDANKDAFLSIGGGGSFYINTSAMEIIKKKISGGKLQWLRIGVNRSNKLLFLKPVPQPEARTLSVDEDSTDTLALTFSSAGLMKEIDYLIPRTIGKARFKAFWDDVNYALVVDISEVVNKDSFIKPAI